MLEQSFGLRDSRNLHANVPTDLRRFGTTTIEGDSRTAYVEQCYKEKLKMFSKGIHEKKVALHAAPKTSCYLRANVHSLHFFMEI